MQMQLRRRLQKKLNASPAKKRGMIAPANTSICAAASYRADFDLPVQ